MIARSVTQPIRRLNDTARRFADGDLTVDGDAHRRATRAPRARPSTMSTMAGRLAALIDEQRAFVADASHQLRTPLTGLRLRLENLQAGTRRADDADRGRLAIDEIARLSTLVTDLLQLARADGHELARRPRPRRARRRPGRHLERRRRHRADPTRPARPTALRLIVRAVPGAIEQILDNVLDNAIGMAPTGTHRDDHRAGRHRQHRLDDHRPGPGLSDEDKARALRRFWRGDTQRPGSGLGLAIAEGLARASGGTLTLHDGPTGGLQVDVVFSAGAPQASAGAVDDAP